MKINEIIVESDTLDPPSISVGDTVKIGKFKNRKATVKGFKKDEHGQPVLKTSKGDQKLYKPRVSKLEPKSVDEAFKDNTTGMPTPDDIIWDDPDYHRQRKINKVK